VPPPKRPRVAEYLPDDDDDASEAAAGDSGSNQVETAALAKQAAAAAERERTICHAAQRREKVAAEAAAEAEAEAGAKWLASSLYAAVAASRRAAAAAAMQGTWPSRRLVSMLPGAAAEEAVAAAEWGERMRTVTRWDIVAQVRCIFDANRNRKQSIRIVHFVTIGKSKSVLFSR
jgi:hypothetical protein